MLMELIFVAIVGISVNVNAECLPNNVCQNAVTVSGYESSGQYECDSGTAQSIAYEDLDCISSESYVVLASNSDDVKCDGTCTEYIQYKEYVIDSSDSTCSNKYAYYTYIVPGGCVSYDDYDISTKWTCDGTNSMTYTTYSKANCEGSGFGVTYNSGCTDVYGEPIYYEIEYCGANTGHQISPVIPIIIMAMFAIFCV